MQLVFLFGLLYFDLHVVPVVDLLLDVLIYLRCNLGLVRNFIAQCKDSLCGSVVIFAQVNEVLLVDLLDGDHVVGGVHGGVLHDGLDTFLLGELG